MNILVGEGQVYHSRKEGAENTFRYPTFFMYFNCEDEPQGYLKKQFWRCLSLTAQDYLAGKPGNFSENIKDFLKENCDYEAEEVWLHTLPRMFGYAFNPVSFWCCYRKGLWNAVLAEVHNTFGERHYYWIYPPQPIHSEEWYVAQKHFHVSPFFPVDGYYKFRFRKTENELAIDINYFSADDQLRLATGIVGQLKDVSQFSLSQLVLKYGWLTPMVILRIHYQALRLWFKKMKFYSKPKKPDWDVN